MIDGIIRNILLTKGAPKGAPFYCTDFEKREEINMALAWAKDLLGDACTES